MAPAPQAGTKGKDGACLTFKLPFGADGHVATVPASYLQAQGAPGLKGKVMVEFVDQDPGLPTKDRMAMGRDAYMRMMKLTLGVQEQQQQPQGGQASAEPRVTRRAAADGKGYQVRHASGSPRYTVWAYRGMRMFAGYTCGCAHACAHHETRMHNCLSM